MDGCKDCGRDTNALTFLKRSAVPLRVASVVIADHRSRLHLRSSLSSSHINRNPLRNLGRAPLPNPQKLVQLHRQAPPLRMSLDQLEAPQEVLSCDASIRAEGRGNKVVACFNRWLWNRHASLANVLYLVCGALAEGVFCGLG